jgi:hypothetical protein
MHKEYLSQRRAKWGYSEIAKRCELGCIDPWYGITGNFQIQINPRIKRGQS